MPGSEQSAGLCIPAEILLPHGASSAWGRLAGLDPAGCLLISRFKLRTGSCAALRFELGDETFEDVMARVRSRDQDADGYFSYRFSFTDRPQSVNLARALARMTAR